MGGKSRRFRKAGVLRALGSQAVQRTIVDRDCEGKRGVWEGGRSSAENSGAAAKSETILASRPVQLRRICPVSCRLKLWGGGLPGCVGTASMVTTGDS